MGRSIPLVFLGSLTALIVVAGEPQELGTATVHPLNDADRARFAERFARTIWPMMAEPSLPEKACLACHREDQSNTSPLVLAGSADAVFARLLENGYFDRKNPAAILTRVAHRNDRYRMPPPPARSWSPAEVKTLRTFVDALNAKRTGPRGTAP